MFPSSLVQYGSPRKAVSHSAKVDIENKRRNIAKLVPVSTDEQITLGASELLDALLPPKTASEGGQFWYQCCSRTPGGTSDLLRLQEQLDADLLKKGAREMGICPIRGELYEQCFEELIRQEVISCPQRGRLLRMVQLEAKLSLKAAMDIYESSVAYGIKKKLMAAQIVTHLTTEVKKLLQELSQLEVEQQNLEYQAPQLKNAWDARDEDIQQNFDNEESIIKKENEALLEQIMESIEISIETEE